jgi:hypothetical protein
VWASVTRMRRAPYRLRPKCATYYQVWVLNQHSAGKERSNDMVALRWESTQPQIQSAKAVVRSEERKIYSREAVRALLVAEQTIERHEKQASRSKQPVTITAKHETWCLRVVPKGLQYSFYFLAEGPEQKTNPEVLTRNEAQRFLALRRVLLE